MEHPAYSQLRPVTDNVGVVLAMNPSYSALEGTNTWIIRGKNDRVSVVVDPGPADEGHLNVVTSKATQDGGQIGLTLLTHRHDDHAAGAHRFRQINGTSIRAVDKTHNYGDVQPLENGEFIKIEGLTPTIEVVTTPGHTKDSVCFFIHSQGGTDDSDVEGIITGDTIAGRHTTMISETDGDLGAYIETLRMLQKRGEGKTLLPGHGPEHQDVSELATKYLERREQRLQQVKQARAELGEDATVGELVDFIYTDVDPVLRSAAEQSTRVAVRYLAEQDN
ncbi:MBL fold metallo-hydrolase [Corynebacterium sp. 320]|uniref:MBL fold metallo-hydrolase n=1 Tax=Corynebacterium zhongnanshanii TaxID=2768834 RepID=A0ABQ6VDW4_9CORY|nr:MULTISPECIES: MBL fold metallo-hydrolase [Corynebacterium]KAB1502875.1 MBL fold metallo-hydrolase [Corynebacterium sp. 320]KAB1552386.1 MBL fold metallo-hydrolase [Corynebacterium sp. 321]KAB1554399.1 MBL fold metallo-hydrolase [Corynebacterium sp. 319]KAB3522632.1 MBL fold metallo-hydrolase [Corynebacterium zhongnanshanii]KAB3526538.1 MBL fold metallo-hydrolase [Corynebacterium sp. 250]